ncbi:MAG: hypothetical protein HY822_18180 [Acidobacteria bacterium]|nr:hypothetical protein [Acidobacteriota bacterium]
MPVCARQYLRKMRGGAQAHLIEAGDGRAYVVKFSNNPQHRRILVNETIASVLLGYLRLSQPETAVVELSPAFLAQNPDVFIQLGTRRVPVPPGRHFGSCYPGDPNRVAVYDFLPDALLDRVANRNEFLGILVFDKWVANADGRQSIFFRARIKEWSAAAGVHALEKGFLAQMVDHGYVFDGPNWEFRDSPLQGLYCRPLVYEKVRGWEDFEPWLSQVRGFPAEVLDDALKRIPPEWVEGDEEALEQLLERLLERRKRAPDLVRGCRAGRLDPFPNWK